MSIRNVSPRIAQFGGSRRRDSASRPGASATERVDRMQLDLAPDGLRLFPGR
ncbi:MAG: hypothetical protein ACJ77A_12525 [Actinomycetota bacterium]